MRKQLMTAAAVLLVSAAMARAQTARQSTPDGEASRPNAAFDQALAGTWKSTPDQMKLTSDFDKSVWGEGASSVRQVELVVRPSGEATLKVTKRVVDAKARTLPASTWVEEAQLKVGGSTPGSGPRIEHETAVVSAVRLFPDEKDYRWELTGLRVKVVTFSDGDGTLEIRYDTPEGPGSFWETLRREGAAPRRQAK